jgi:hypothetical protein
MMAEQALIIAPFIYQFDELYREYYLQWGSGAWNGLSQLSNL